MTYFITVIFDLYSCNSRHDLTIFLYEYFMKFWIINFYKILLNILLKNKNIKSQMFINIKGKKIFTITGILYF